MVTSFEGIPDWDKGSSLKVAAFLKALPCGKVVDLFTGYFGEDVFTMGFAEYIIDKDNKGGLV